MRTWLRNRRKKRAHLYIQHALPYLMARLCTGAIVQKDSKRWTEERIEFHCERCMHLDSMVTSARLRGLELSPEERRIANNLTMDGPWG